MNAPALIEQYFVRAVDPDQEAYIALFAPDVVVVDDGHEHRGADAVRAWRADVPAVRYAVREVTASEAGGYAVAEVAGDFPGSPVDLRHAFRFDDDGKIAALTIRP